MSNSSTRSQNNIKAGIFVTIAILVGMSVIFILGDYKAMFGPLSNSFIVTYPVTSGVGGLRSGSFVDIGGIQVGQVSTVELDVLPSGPLTMIEVEFSIPASITLREDAVVSVRSGLLSSDSWLSFTSMGTDGRVLESGDVLEGSSMSMLDTLLGAESADNLSATLESMSVIANKLERDGALAEWVLGEESADTFRGAIDEGNELLTLLNQDWQEWSGEIDKVMAQADAFAQAMENVSELINDNSGTFQDIVENVDEAIATAAACVKEFRETSWPQVEDFIDRAQVTISDVQDVVGDVKVRSGAWLGDIDSTLANLTIASLQLNQLLTEVKASPWRLLYRPTDKQLGQELVYEASRNFVFGAADLKAAADSMQRLIDARGAALAPDDPQLRVIRENLLRSVERYQQAQEQLMDVLRGPVEDSGSK
jgi:phospholipid/cholesterol/gamma-HCH transport system substrate-binding protein